jgi:hypothetical protein
MSRLVRLAAAAVGSITMITVVGACTGSGGGGSSDAGSARGGAAVVGAPHAAATPVASAPARRSYGSGGGSASVGRFAAVDIGTAKIRIASMTVQVKRGDTVAAQANRAEAITLGAGGEVDSDDRTSGRNAVATLVVRVPPDQLTPTLTQLSRLGTEKGRQLSTQDVTSNVADINSRVASARAAIVRLRVLFQRARKIADVITLESELSTRESDLESLQAQQRALAAETSTAAITLTLTSPPRRVHHVPPKPKHHDSGFIAGLRGGWHAFVTGLVAISTVLGAALPFLVLLAVFAVLARLLWPRLRPPHRPAPSGPSD